MVSVRWPVRAVLVVAAGAALAAGVVGARAAGETVQIVAAGPSCTGSTFCYVPATQNAVSGDTVTWANSSPDFHTVTRCSAAACSGQGPGTGADALDSGGNITPVTGTYAHAFSASGTYYYYCTIHGYAAMHGEVIVTAGPPAGAPETPVTALLLGAGALGLGAAVWRRHAVSASATGGQR